MRKPTMMPAMHNPQPPTAMATTPHPRMAAPKKTAARKTGARRTGRRGK